MYTPQTAFKQYCLAAGATQGNIAKAQQLCAIFRLQNKPTEVKQKFR